MSSCGRAASRRVASQRVLEKDREGLGRCSWLIARASLVGGREQAGLLQRASAGRKWREIWPNEEAGLGYAYPAVRGLVLDSVGVMRGDGRARMIIGQCADGVGPGRSVALAGCASATEPCPD